MAIFTTLVCSISLAAAPIIEDAPCHNELPALTSVPSQEIDESLNSPLLSQESLEEPLLQIAPGIDLALEELSFTGVIEGQLEPLMGNITITPLATFSTDPAVIISPAINTNAEVPTKEIAYEPATTETFAVAQKHETTISLKEVFSGAPLIYALLFLMSLSAVTLWLYHFILVSKEKLMPISFAQIVENRLALGNWQEALSLCQGENSLFSNLISASIQARHEGSQAMIERMQAEGKRATNFLWQRLSLLNDVALIAPMIGLLGTVVGMFYAFYDVNRTIESMYTLFDGLGISVGTTVGGLIVAIMALLLHSSLKYRLVRQLSFVEAKAQQVALHPVQFNQVPSGELHELNT